MPKLSVFFNIAVLLLSSFMLSSCASGAHLVTGIRREAVSADTVVIYTEFPEQYEAIGIVTAVSGAGWTAQGNLDYAIAELKKQAAKIGANGVVIESMGVIVGNIFVTDFAQKVSGKAIYVASDTQKELQ